MHFNPFRTELGGMLHWLFCKVVALSDAGIRSAWNAEFQASTKTKGRCSMSPEKASKADSDSGHEKAQQQPNVDRSYHHRSRTGHTKLQPAARRSTVLQS